MKYDNLLNDEINKHVNKSYAKFHSSIVPNCKIRGVKIPILREIAKMFSKYEDFLENISLDNYEAISVACYYIGLTTKDISLLKSRLDFILPYVNNWAICDTFVSSLKVLKKYKSSMYPTVLNYLDSNNDFIVRFGIVCLLSYYVDNANATALLEKLTTIKTNCYYVDMAIAWFISVAFVKSRDETLVFLKDKRFNKNIHNKSISKICDSFRVSADDKMLVKSLKID